MTFKKIDDITWINVGIGNVEYIRQHGTYATIHFRSHTYIRFKQTAEELVSLLSEN